MSKTPRTAALLCAVAVAGLAGCNSTPAPPADPAALREQATQLKTILPLALGELAGAVREGGRASRASAALAPTGLGTAAGPRASTGNCGPSAAPTDADRDKVAADFSYAYDCTVVLGGLTLKYKGSVRSLDGNDNDPKSDYSTRGDLRYDLTLTDDASKTSSVAFAVRWDATAVRRSDGGYDIAVDKSFTYNPDTDNSRFGFRLTAGYLPDNDGNAVPTDAGTLSFDGEASFTNAAGRLSRYRLTSTNLHFGPSCPGGLDRGVVRSEHVSNLGPDVRSVLELTATGCKTWSATYNGSVF